MVRHGRDVSDHGDGTHSVLPVPLGGRIDRAGVPAPVALAGGHDHSPGGSETDSHCHGCCHDHVDHLCSYLRGRGSCWTKDITIKHNNIRHPLILEVLKKTKNMHFGYSICVIDLA